MYPLRMTRSLAVVAGVAALALPSAASAAELNVSPQKSCYSSGESINLLGTGFSPLGSASVTRDGSLLGALSVDGSGAFNGVLTLAQNSGKQTKTYTATDGTDPSITASKQIVVSSVRVGLKPASGAPGRILRINARGFTTGKTLWAHIKRGKSKRTIKLGRLDGRLRLAADAQAAAAPGRRPRGAHAPVRHVPALQPEAAGARPLHDHRHARLTGQSGWPVMTASGVWPGMASVSSSK